MIYENRKLATSYKGNKSIRPSVCWICNDNDILDAIKDMYPIGVCETQKQNQDMVFLVLWARGQFWVGFSNYKSCMYVNANAVLMMKRSRLSTVCLAFFSFIFLSFKSTMGDHFQVSIFSSLISYSPWKTWYPNINRRREISKFIIHVSLNLSKRYASTFLCVVRWQFHQLLFKLIDAASPKVSKNLLFVLHPRRAFPLEQKLRVLPPIMETFASFHASNDSLLCPVTQWKIKQQFRNIWGHIWFIPGHLSLCYIQKVRV